MTKSEMITVIRGARTKMFKAQNIMFHHYNEDKFDSEVDWNDFKELLDQANVMIKTVRNEVS